MAVPPAPAVPLRRRHRHARPAGGGARAHPRRRRPRGLGRRGGNPGREVVRQGPALDGRAERAPAPPRAGDRGSGVARGGREHGLRALRGRLCRARGGVRAGRAEPAGRRLRPRAPGPRRARCAAEAARRGVLGRHGGEHRRFRAARGGGARPRRLRPRRDAGGADAAAQPARAPHGGAGGPDHRRRPGRAGGRRPAGNAGGGGRDLRPRPLQAEGRRERRGGRGAPGAHRRRAGPLAGVPGHARRQRAVRERGGRRRAVARDAGRAAAGAAAATPSCSSSSR